MKNPFVQALIIILFFFGLFFSMTKIDWMRIFNVEQASQNTEEKLGDLFWEMIKKSDKEIKNKDVIQIIDSLFNKMCDANNIDRSSIKLHIIENDNVNAFALPNRHLVIYSGLIIDAKNEAALCGVLGHELAHIELNHVMKKLIKELGLSVLIGMTTGNGGGEVMKQAAKLLSSSAYDRTLEQEADLKAVDYLHETDLSPEPFAEFLYNISNNADANQYLSWISTHPDSKERAEYILTYRDDVKMDSKPILSANTWQKLKDILN